MHTDLNPTQIVPLGPDPGGWLTPHGREQLGGRPFGDGTPPGPPAVAEVVPTTQGGGSRRAEDRRQCLTRPTGARRVAALLAELL